MSAGEERECGPRARERKRERENRGGEGETREPRVGQHCDTERVSTGKVSDTKRRGRARDNELLGRDLDRSLSVGLVVVVVVRRVRQVDGVATCELAAGPREPLGAKSGFLSIRLALLVVLPADSQ